MQTFVPESNHEKNLPIWNVPTNRMKQVSFGARTGTKFVLAQEG